MANVPTAGILNQVSFKRESTWGTAVVPDKSLPVRPSGGITADIDAKPLTAIKAIAAKNYTAIKGAAKYGGDFAMELFSDHPGNFIAAAIGADTPTLHTSETTVYDHAIAENLATKASYTIEQVVGVNIQRFAGLIPESFKITVKKGEAVEFSPKFQGQSVATASKISPTYLTARPYTFADSVLKIGGSIVTEVVDFEMEFKNNLEMIYGLSSNNPIAYQCKSHEVSGKVSLILDSTSLTELTAYLAETLRSMELILTQPDVTIGNASHPTMDFVLPSVMYKTAVTKINDSYNLLEINYEGIYDSVTSKLISATITNLLATFA